MLLCHIWSFHFFNFSITFVKKFMKKLPVLRQIFRLHPIHKVLVKVEIPLNGYQNFQKKVYFDCLYSISKLKNYEIFNVCSLWNMRQWLLYVYKPKSCKLAVYKVLFRHYAYFHFFNIIMTFKLLVEFHYVLKFHNIPTLDKKLGQLSFPISRKMY